MLWGNVGTNIVIEKQNRCKMGGGGIIPLSGNTKKLGSPDIILELTLVGRSQSTLFHVDQGGETRKCSVIRNSQTNISFSLYVYIQILDSLTTTEKLLNTVREALAM